MNRSGMKCVLYPRVSTEMQVDGFSLDGQRSSLKRFADREEMTVVDIYEDAGKSGKSIEGRPAFKKMLSDIENGLQIDYILVYKLSRFGRNAADILNSLEFIQSYGINLICIEEGIDSSQASGKLLISVLSAVAEIERENIIEQTMNGRKEKARQGGWNGGFAPYGYYLKDKNLFIQEEEAEVIRIIYDKFANTEMGYGGVAQYLNLQGIKKIQRQNGKLSEWSGHLVRQILDNPVYCGKIAFGRRAKEKVKGTKNQYRQAWQEEYIVADGKHEAIISEELWNKVREKRIETGIKQPSKVGKDRSHLLTGLLRCPVCGGPMYTNKHAWTNKDGTYKEVYYYVCSRNRMVRGKSCTYKAMLKKTEIEPLVIASIKELVSNKTFAKEVKSRIGTQIDTTTIDREIKNYESKLREVDLNKARLENEIDTLPEDTRYRDRKLHDMTIRLDGLYDIMVELEEKIEDAKLKRRSVEMNAITLDNVYRLMINFEKMYDRINDEERKALVSSLIKEIQIYPRDETEVPLKSIFFNFPVFKEGEEVQELLWDKDTHVETVVLLSQQKPDDTIEIDLDLDELDATSAELKATYQEIKDYVLKEFGLKVSSLYISQVKRKCGIEVGENYNLPKSENARVPQCPKEKEDAIKA
ncbi:MAG: recombinase family protein, partial [Anaerobutyricum hallii]|uniref:recombinase family protein n=1 Tax=Anaerobutyricum hallii TaxID=39488 RepID=UPI002A7FB47B